MSKLTFFLTLRRWIKSWQSYVDLQIEKLTVAQPNFSLPSENVDITAEEETYVLQVETRKGTDEIDKISVINAKA